MTEFHELANVFPMLQQTELESLAADIRANGQRHAITLYQGKILDGRNRYAADTKECWLVSFQLLRIAFRRNITRWKKEYRSAIQTSDHGGRSWKSECVFIPIAQVEYSINEISHGDMAVKS